MPINTKDPCIMMGTERTLKTCRVLCALLLFAGSMIQPALAQVVDPPATSDKSSAPESVSIAASDIPTRTGGVRDLVREAEAIVADNARMAEIQQTFGTELQRFNDLREQTDELLQTKSRTSQIEETVKATLRARDRLEQWMDDLSERSQLLESTLRDLQDERLLWELTRDEEREDELPEALVEQVSDAIAVITLGEESVRSAWDSALDLQASIGQQQSALIELLAVQQAEIEDRSAGLFQIDSPPLWSMFGAVTAGEAGVLDQIDNLVRERMGDITAYAIEMKYPLLSWLIVWAGLAATLALMHRRATVVVQQDRSLETTVALLNRPMIAAAVITLLASSIFDEKVPTAWIDVTNLLLLLTVLLLLFGMLPKSLRLIPYLMIPLAVLLRVTELSPVASATQRLALLALSAFGVACCVWFLRVVPADTDRLSEAWRRWVVWGVRAAILLLAIGLMANLFGGVRLGTVLGVGTVKTIFTAILLVVVSALLRAAVRVALITPAARGLGIAPDHSETVSRALFRTIALVITIIWVVFTLRGFSLYDSVVAEFGRVLKAQLSIGDFSVTPGNLLIFVIIIWLSIKLAALVDFVVEVLIAPCLDLPKGAPQALSRVSRYLVIVVGFMIACSAIGLDVSKAALVAGGLGVGVGFGLQNVVNNFVSGLILLFERPIRVGDIIELGDISGVVENVGMRATLVRTWRGSELIVPNANLISSEVINRTLKRDRRRIEIPVGVDYGSDPDVVAEVLIEAADEHAEVRKQPKPQCLFKGLGESTLDFELRAWVNARHCIRLDSELRFAVVRKLRGAGIKIPFPQRDLHIRNADSQPSDGLVGGIDAEEKPTGIPEEE